MPAPLKRKLKKKEKHIVARSISLKDAKGRLRIHMDAGSGDGFATICLFAEGNRVIQIATLPDGGLHIALMGQQGGGETSLALSAEGDAGLCIRDREGLLGTMLGSVLDSGKHRLVLFHDGQPYWSTPRPQKKKERRNK
ncbi:MAG: hypothetical protein ABI318_01915 [Chthoniobacteraceae bacterium]